LLAAGGVAPGFSLIRSITAEEVTLLHQRYKDLHFLLIAKATWPNYWTRSLRYRLGSPNGQRLHLHLGCGTKYLPGFANVDANPTQKIDVWLDVRCGLPFATQSVDG
jgi:hypothetical protein